MKIYCRNCGKGIDYELKAPSICGYCSASYSAASAPKIESPKQTQPISQPVGYSRQSSVRPLSRFNRRNEVGQEDLQDTDDSEFLDIDLNDPDYQDIGLNYSTVQRNKISDVRAGNTQNNVEYSISQEPDIENTQVNQSPPPAAKEKRKPGRPSKNADKQQILEEFQREAGAIKPKSRK